MKTTHRFVTEEEQDNYRKLRVKLLMKKPRKSFSKWLNEKIAKEVK